MKTKIEHLDVDFIGGEELSQEQKKLLCDFFENRKKSYKYIQHNEESCVAEPQLTIMN